MMYVRISEGLNKYKLVPETENIYDHIINNDKDYYTSLFKYNEEHYQHWKKTRTVSGIKDVLTNRLFFDFDNAENPDLARQDAITLVSRLLTNGVPQDNIQVAFSGGKGFSVEVDTTQKFTQDEFKNITFALAEDLESFDRVVNDPQRIVRVVGTKHNKSGLYKMPLTVHQLTELPVSEIKAQASNLDNIDPEIMESWTEIELPESIAKLAISTKKETKKVAQVDSEDLNLQFKPKWLTEAKYALQCGFFGAGERNTAFMILASTYKNQGFDKEIVYRMLKGVAEVQANRNGVERYADKELYNNIVEVVFNPNWKGGTYSYENTPLLRDVTQRLGLKIPNDNEDNPLVPVENVTDIFKKFALDIDNNTIKLGIPLIDNNIRITTSMLVGLLAAPSAGKTSVSLSVLNACSNNNIPCVFFSLDMGAPLVFQRLIQRHSGLYSKKIFEMYKNDDPKIRDIEKEVSKQYKNVRFCFKSGITVEDIKENIMKQQEASGEKIRLVVIDYLECLGGPYSDATANTAMIAQKLKDIANELEICILLLLQPQKHAGDPSAELLSYRNIKGSSAVEQAASVVFTLWRPGFSPKNPEEDKYMTVAVVKNRMGSLGAFDFSWNGLTGDIEELDEIQKGELNALRQKRASEKAAADLF